MAAPDYESIYNYEDAIESAVKTLFVANDITTYRQRDDDEVATPYCGIQFTVGAATGHLAQLPEGGERPDQFAATLRVMIFTDRARNAADHETLRAKIRHLIYGFQENVTRADTPYHTIFAATESGSTQAVQTEDKQDVSEITFNIGFGIRRDAWPH